MLCCCSPWDTLRGQRGDIVGVWEGRSGARKGTRGEETICGVGWWAQGRVPLQGPAKRSLPLPYKSSGSNTPRASLGRASFGGTSIFLSWDPLGWVLIGSAEANDSAWTYLELLGSPTVVRCSWIQDPRIPQCSVHPQAHSASARGNELGCWFLSHQLAATSPAGQPRPGSGRGEGPDHP